jgi:hypothetical protein
MTSDTSALPRPGSQPVAYVADGLDQSLVLDAKLGSESADVDVDRARAAVVVVTPDLSE